MGIRMEGACCPLLFGWECSDWWVRGTRQVNPGLGTDCLQRVKETFPPSPASALLLPPPPASSPELFLCRCCDTLLPLSLPLLCCNFLGVLWTQALVLAFGV